MNYINQNKIQRQPLSLHWTHKGGLNMEIVRGDNKSFKFQRKDKNGVVITTQPDEIYFTVKKDSTFSDALIQKSLKAGTITYDKPTQYYSFELTPSDTDNLSYGEYGYDIEIIVGGKKKTIVVGKLKVTEEYTHTINEV